MIIMIDLSNQIYIKTLECYSSFNNAKWFISYDIFLKIESCDLYMRFIVDNINKPTMS